MSQLCIVYQVYHRIAILNSLPIINWQFLITSQISVTITCGIQPISIVTMAVEVLHNICTHGLPDRCALMPAALRAQAYISMHIRQIICTHVTTITCTIHYIVVESIKYRQLEYQLDKYHCR